MQFDGRRLKQIHELVYLLPFFPRIAITKHEAEILCQSEVKMFLLQYHREKVFDSQSLIGVKRSKEQRRGCWRIFSVRTGNPFKCQER